MKPVLAFIVLLLFLAIPIRLNNVSQDTVPTALLPISIINDHTLYLDSFYTMLDGMFPNPRTKDINHPLTPYFLRKVDAHYVSAFPVITSILAVPLYFLPVKLGMPLTWANILFLASICSAFIIYLSAVAIHFFCKKILGIEQKISLLLTLCYVCATINLALISKELWQHGTLQLFTIIYLYFYMSYLKNRALKNAFFFGLFGGLALLSRPTAALPLGIFLLMFVYKELKTKNFYKPLLLVFFGLALNVTFFLWYNNKYYKSVLNQGYSNQVLTEWKGRFPEGFLGVWFSPSKGILVYSPIFIFSIIGIYLAYKNKSIPHRGLYLCSGLIVLIHTLIISMWKHWYGGWSFGYRMSSDIIPFFIILLVPYLKSQYYQKYKKLFYAALIWSFLVEIIGLVFYDGLWHAAYDKGFENTSWLWSIKDSEFVFYVRRVLVKFDILNKACPQCL